MKALVLKTLIFAVVFFAATLSGFASHPQGGEITYTNVAPGVYTIKHKYFHDCGIVPNNNVTLDIKAVGCAGNRTANMYLVSSTINQPYCSGLNNNCTGPNTPTGVYEYAATVTLTPAEQNCAGGVIISVTEGIGRATVANLVNSQGDLYFEALIKPANGISNSSAVINATAPDVEHVCVGQDARLNVRASDPDCDSLSYELVAPLSAYNTPYVYKPISSYSNGYFPNPNPPAPYCNVCPNGILNPQFGYFAGAPITTYSPTYPLPSYNANWNAINPATGVPHQFVPAYNYFQLTQAGEIRFRPAVYFNTPPLQGDNKYVVVVKINEWRKINGVITKVGYTRRDMLFIVEDCGSNLNPFFTNVTISPQQSLADTIIKVPAGSQLNMQFSTFDQSSDTLTLDTDVTTQLPGATFTQTSAAKPTGTITWTAPSNNGACGIRYFYIRVRDNACPIRGKKVYEIGVKVMNTGTATGTKEELKTDLNFTAYPNPFSQEVSFKFNSQKAAREIRIYNLLGQEIDVVKVNSNENEIRWEKAARFASGTYVAKLITSDNSVQTLKFSKLQ